MSQDEFDEARSAFVKQEHLKGCLLLVTPTGQGERESTLPGANGKPYTYVVADTVVLDTGFDKDGKPLTNDMVEETPTELADFQLSGASLVGQLLPKIRKGRKVLGRLGKAPSQTKGFGEAWVLAEPTEADKVVARAYLASVKDDGFA